MPSAGFAYAPIHAPGWRETRCQPANRASQRQRVAAKTRTEHRAGQQTQDGYEIEGQSSPLKRAGRDTYPDTVSWRERVAMDDGAQEPFLLPFLSGKQVPGAASPGAALPTLGLGIAMDPNKSSTDTLDRRFAHDHRRASRVVLCIDPAIIRTVASGTSPTAVTR